MLLAFGIVKQFYTKALNSSEIVERLANCGITKTNYAHILITTPSLMLNTKQLYEQDFYLWVTTTIQKIRDRDFDSVDWENVLEELEDLGSERKNELESRLMVLFEHLLKLAYWDEEREYNERGWKGTIREQRKRLNRLLRKNPSLKPYLDEVFEEIYLDARDITIDKTGLSPDTFPVQPIVTVEQALDEAWLPSDVLPR